MSARAWLAGTALALAAGGCTVASDDASDEQALTAVEFDLMHTKPVCHHDSQPDTFCTRDDQAAGAQAAGMETRVNAILDRATDPAKAKIVIAYFSFSNSAVYAKLCEKGKAGFDIEGFFDQSYRAGMPSQLASECQGPSGKNVRMHYLGQLSQDPYVWRLHHNKFLMVDTGDSTAPVSLNFSSGNLSGFGLSLHFDHWVVMRAPRSSNLVKQHGCVVAALRKAINPTGAAADAQLDDPNVYRKTLDACLAAQGTLWKPGKAWVETAIAREGIAPLFSPDPAGDTASIVIDEIGRVTKGGKIYGAMQHFLHYGIADALAAAVKRGVEVRLVMDAGVITGTSEVEGVKEFYDSYLRPSSSGMKIQFILTNATDHQMMHNKFLVMQGVDGKKTRVFSGAGHFTDAGMHDNYENFYLSQNDTLSAKYTGLFNYLWPRTRTETQLAH